MFTKVKKISIIAVVLTISLLNVAFAAPMEPFANNVFRTHEVTLITAL